MTGAEFRAARAAAGLSIRGAGAELGVSPSTIQRWQMDESRIPADAAERIMLLAQSDPPTPARTLGTLFAILERVTGRDAPQSVVTLITSAPGAAIAQMIRLARQHNTRYRCHEDEVEELMGDLTHLPPFLTPAQDAEFWLAYYHRRPATPPRAPSAADAARSGGGAAPPQRTAAPQSHRETERPTR